MRPASGTILHFGAVHHHAEVWVNGTPVVEHTGSYLPFEADIMLWVHGVIGPEGAKVCASSITKRPSVS
jgi:beta-galactosidase/beta-glucuronidase